MEQAGHSRCQLQCPKEKSLNISRRTSGPTENLEQWEGEPQCDILEEYRGQHESVRIQSKTMQALGNIAVVYATFEEAGAKPALRRRAYGYARNLEVGMKTIELKRTADDAHDRTRSYRDRCWTVTTDLVSAEEDPNESPGRLGQLIKETAGATHALSCGVLDLDYNEAKYLQEAFDMIDNFQRRTSQWGCEGQQTAEVIW